MNLNELREAMASDATKENEQLKRDLASLKKRYHYSDVDVLGLRMPRKVGDQNNPGSSGIEVYDVPMSYDVEAVKISIRNILMWRVGESVLRPEFGHKLHLSMY